MLSYTHLLSGAMRLADEVPPSVDFPQVIIYLQHIPQCLMIRCRCGVGSFPGQSAQVDHTPSLKL